MERSGVNGSRRLGEIGREKTGDPTPTRKDARATERDYEALFASARKAQLEKLTEREERGDWKDLSMGRLWFLLMGEVMELRAEIANGRFSSMRREAADVANYASMMIELCDRKIAEGF